MGILKPIHPPVCKEPTVIINDPSYRAGGADGAAGPSERPDVDTVAAVIREVHSGLRGTVLVDSSGAAVRIGLPSSDPP